MFIGLTVYDYANLELISIFHGCRKIFIAKLILGWVSLYSQDLTAVSFSITTGCR